MKQNKSSESQKRRGRRADREAPLRVVLGVGSARGPSVKEERSR